MNLAPGLVLSLSLLHHTDVPLSVNGKMSGPQYPFRLPPLELSSNRCFDLSQERLLEFRHLSDGWNGPNSVGVLAEVLSRVELALHVVKSIPTLPEPELTPTNHGTISLEWASKHAEVYIEVGKTRMSGFIKGEGGRLTLLSGMKPTEETFFRSLSEMLSPTAGTTVSSVRFASAGRTTGMLRYPSGTM